MLGSRSVPQLAPVWRRWLPIAVSLAAVAVVVTLVWLQPAATTGFPAEWNLHLREPIDDFQSWVIGNRATHPMFLWFFEPLSDFIDIRLRQVEAVLLGTPWPIVILVTALLGYWLGGWGLVAWSVGGFLFMGLVGLWTESMQTLALMGVSVFISLLIGIPLGILSARSNAVNSALRPILDGMQTMPAFVYLIPVLLFFGVARVPSVVATVIYALPPAIRLTNLGIRQVSPEAIEAARSYGSTSRQMLFKVQLPLALPTIMAGVNQTIMMALGIVVIAALIGAGGLGREVLLALQRLRVGRAFEAGLSIVFLAIILDRLSEGLSRLDLTEVRRPRLLVGWQRGLVHLWRAPAQALAWAGTTAVRGLRLPLSPETVRSGVLRQQFLISAILLLSLTWLFDGWMLPGEIFPKDWRVPVAAPIDATVAWMRDNLYQIGELPIGTGPFSDFLTTRVLNPLRDLFTHWLPWPVTILGMMLLGYSAGRWRLAFLAGAGFFSMGLLGMWAASMDTFSQVLAAVAVTVALALPLGTLTSRSDRLQVLMRPVLDTLQTIPSFVFLVPVIMLFNVGRVPGLIASVLYALPPGIKLIDLGLRHVASETVEAAHAFGSTEWQTLTKVKFPLALPALMLGINQIIMMVLAMVIIAGLVGGGGLGLEAVTGLARNQTGRGIEAGLAIVLMAIVLDRITQAWAARYRH